MTDLKRPALKHPALTHAAAAAYFEDQVRQQPHRASVGTWEDLDEEARQGWQEAIAPAVDAVVDLVLAPTEVTTVEEIDDLPVGTVLLCSVSEVFQKATSTTGLWLAAGYGDTWTAAEVSEWAPLRILHLGVAS